MCIDQKPKKEKKQCVVWYEISCRSKLVMKSYQWCLLKLPFLFHKWKVRATNLVNRIFCNFTLCMASLISFADHHSLKNESQTTFNALMTHMVLAAMILSSIYCGFIWGDCIAWPMQTTNCSVMQSKWCISSYDRWYVCGFVFDKNTCWLLSSLASHDVHVSNTITIMYFKLIYLLYGSSASMSPHVWVCEGTLHKMI